MDDVLYIITTVLFVIYFCCYYNNYFFQIYCGHIIIMVNVNLIYCANPSADKPLQSPYYLTIYDHLTPLSVCILAVCSLPISTILCWQGAGGEREMDCERERQRELRERERERER